MSLASRARLPLPAALCTVLLAAGCASYRPAPLEPELPAASLSTIVADAATIDRPFLKPRQINLSAPLDDQAIAILAVLGNPDLKALRVRAKVAQAQAFAARLLPDPTFSTSVDHLVSGPDLLDAIAGSIGVDLDALRTAHVVRAAATAALAQVRLDLAWAEWQTAGQAQIQAARIRGLEAAAADQRAAADRARQLLDRTLRAVLRGDLAAGGAEAARTAAFDTADRQRVAERDLAAARFELARLIGLPAATTVAIGTGPRRDVALDPDRLAALAVARRADLAALLQGYASQEATLHKAVLDQFPTLALNVHASRDTANNFVVGPGVDFTLPVWNRNRGGIAIQRATRAALASEYAARIAQTRAEIAAATSGIVVARRQRDAIATELPVLERLATVSRRAAGRGDIADAAAQSAENAARDRRIALAAANQAIDEQMVALILLTGTPVEDWQ